MPHLEFTPVFKCIDYFNPNGGPITHSSEDEAHHNIETIGNSAARQFYETFCGKLSRVKAKSSYEGTYFKWVLLNSTHTVNIYVDANIIRVSITHKPGDAYTMFKNQIEFEVTKDITENSDNLKEALIWAKKKLAPRLSKTPTKATKLSLKRVARLKQIDALATYHNSYRSEIRTRTLSKRAYKAVDTILTDEFISRTLGGVELQENHQATAFALGTTIWSNIPADLE